MSNRWIPTFLYLRDQARKELRLATEIGIVRRWEAGENYIDIAHDVGWKPHRVRWLIEDSQREPEPPREPNPALLTRCQIRDRNRCLIEWRHAGVTYRELSEAFGISPENCRFIFLRGTGELKRRSEHKEREGIIGARIWEESGIGILDGEAWRLTALATSDAAKRSYVEGMTHDEWLKAGLELFAAWRAEHPYIQGPLELE